MLSIQLSDVYNVLKTCMPYLIAFAVITVIAIAIMILCRKAEVAKRKLIRGEAGIGILLTLVVVVNLICTGPMNTLLTLVSGDGALSDETSDASLEMVREICEEGITVLQNEDNVLPLKDMKLNVFGWASTNPCYGGAGSGSLSHAYPFTSLLDGLASSGVEVNTELTDFYTAYRADRPVVSDWSQDWTLPEPSTDKYDDAMIENAKAYSDKAMLVFTRVGGECVDLPSDMTNIENYEQHYNSDSYEDFPAGASYLSLSTSERNLVDLVCSNFDDVIVVINAANTMDISFVRQYDQIKSVIWCPGAGQNGFDAFGEILTGAINPSGRTTDTWVSDIDATPTANNFGENAYTNMDEYADKTNENPFWETYTYIPFVNYVEGIYVGYKYYETAFVEAQQNGYDFDYDKEVIYPFGSGISYTTFTQEITNFAQNADGVSFDVTVTNTGDVAGRDVVEVYYTPPYYNGGIEKAAVNLIDFAKTDMIEAGASQTLSFAIALEDMASFDSYGEGCYVLDDGAYTISIRKNAHEAIDSADFTVDKKIVYNENNPRSTDQTAAVSMFDYAEGDVTYLSRADGFANYDIATAAPATELSDTFKDTFINSANYVGEVNDADEMPQQNQKNGLTLAELRGADYDDERWEKLIDQMSISDMNTLISLAGFQTKEISSVGLVATVDCDGPAAINNNFTKVGSVGLPSEVVIGAAWNKNVALTYGQTMGKMADEMNVSGWYGPACNIHRSSYAGRNFEYVSEDGVLSGYVVAEAVKGAMENGVYAYVKHFVGNDQETNRQRMLCTFMTEQALREIYLKPFEMAVKDGGTTAMMSSYNYIGTRWAGGTPELETAVLRDEWGFKGHVLSDYWVGSGYMNADQAIRSGTDAVLLNMDFGSNNVKDQTSATSIKAMRNACHNIMYTIVNSRSYSDEVLNPGMSAWVKILIAADVVLGLLIVALEVVTIKNYKKRKANA